MKVTLLILWLILTFMLAISVIGWVLLLPQANNTEYHKPLSETRSTWMRVGHGLFESIIKN